MKSVIAVATTVTEVLEPGDYKLILLENKDSSETIYLDFTNKQSDLTTSNGLAVKPGERFTLLNSSNPEIFFKGGVSAIHGGSGTKNLLVQAVL